MSRDSGIEWTGHTWNPVLGCEKVSAGCARCYAVPLAHRLGHNPHPQFHPFRGLTGRAGQAPSNWTGVVRCLPDRLADPLAWADAGPVFVNSLSDLFHDAVPEGFIRRVFGVMLLAGWHPFQVLTKRPQRLLDLAPRLPWPANVWVGVSFQG